MSGGSDHSGHRKAELSRTALRYSFRFQRMTIDEGDSAAAVMSLPTGVSLER